MDTDLTNTISYEDLSLKIQPYNDWRFSDNYSNRQFQQFSSNKCKDKSFKYILCQMLNNQGQRVYIG